MATIGIGAAQTPIVGTVSPTLIFQMQTNTPNTFGTMVPVNTYTTGNNILVSANCPFQIVTTCSPSDGYMASVANPSIKLHQAMLLTLDGTQQFSLSGPVTKTFPKPTFVPFPIPTTFEQSIDWNDNVLASSDKYQLIATFTLTPI